MGLLDENDPAKAEIARLEALLAQMSTSPLEQLTPELVQGILSMNGPQPSPPLPPPPPTALDQMSTSPLQNPPQPGGPIQMMGDGSQLPPEAAGLLQELAQVDDTEFLKPGNDPLPMTAKDQIKQLENQIQMMQAQQPDGSGGIYGLLGYDAKGGLGSQPFKPTMSPDAMQDIYGLLAGGADNPAAVGQQYVKSMQANDTLKAAMKDARIRVTDAMRPRPVGSGYTDDKGDHIIPVWDPQLNDGRGGMVTHNTGQKFPDTINVAGMDWARNPNVEGYASKNSWIPLIDPTRAGEVGGEIERGIAVGKAEGAEQASGMLLAGEMMKVEGLLTSLMDNPDFEGGVGLADQYTGKIGAQFGTKEGIVSKQATFISNALTRSSVADWKGAISEKELVFFQSGVPQPGDGPEVWRMWYRDFYLPILEFARKKAAGTIHKDAPLMPYLESVQNQNRYSTAEQAAIDEAMGTP